MSKSPVIRIDFSYKGTHFKGYQKQIKERTVQGELEKALGAIHQEKTQVFCAGRTDTGVHALHQVISYKPTKNILDSKELKKALNSLLPSDIRILSIKREHSKFHGRFSPKKRTYLYIIQNSLEFSPFDAEVYWNYPLKLNPKKLKQALSCFVGEHNFKSVAEKASGKNYVRTIYQIKVKKKKNFFFIYITGNSFLRRMIRNIVGAAVQVASKEDIPAQTINFMLKAQDRNRSPFPTAPPQGLYFYKIDF